MIDTMVKQQKRPAQYPMIIKNFRQVKLDKNGWRIIERDDGGWQRDPSNEWYPPGEPLWEFNLYFAASRRYYDTQYVRARDNRQARRKIKRLYPWVTRYEFGDKYAD